jgi:hypothetical protein
VCRAVSEKMARTGCGTTEAVNSGLDPFLYSFYILINMNHLHCKFIKRNKNKM